MTGHKIPIVSRSRPPRIYDWEQNWMLNNDVEKIYQGSSDKCRRQIDYGYVRFILAKQAHILLYKIILIILMTMFSLECK